MCFSVDLRLTRNCFTNPSILLSICACSDAETAWGGVCRSCGPESGKRTRFMTQHHIGTVLESASGIPAPD